MPGLAAYLTVVKVAKQPRLMLSPYSVFFLLFPAGSGRAELAGGRFLLLS